MSISHKLRSVLLATSIIALMSPLPARSNFAGTDLILPAAGRVLGAGGTEFVTTAWVSNPTDHAVDVQFQFLQAGQANTSPITVTDTLNAGQTKSYPDAVNTLFHISGLLGAMRVRSSDQVLVSARIYSLAPGQTLADTTGVYFGAVPASFSIGNGEQASLQGVSQNGDFRYNFFLVETSGQPASIVVRLLDGSGSQIASKTYSLLPFEQVLVSTTDLAPGLTFSDGLIDASVEHDRSGHSRRITRGERQPGLNWFRDELQEQPARCQRHARDLAQWAEWRAVADRRRRRVDHARRGDEQHPARRFGRTGPDRPARRGRTNRCDRAGRTDGGSVHRAGTDRTDGADRTRGTDRSSIHGAGTDRTDRAGGTDRSNRHDRTPRPDGICRSDRRNGPDRRDRRNGVDRSHRPNRRDGSRWSAGRDRPHRIHRSDR